MVIMSIGSNSSFAQHHASKVKKALQQKWIKKTIHQLKKDDTMKLLKLTEPAINSAPGFTMISYRINGDTRIQCASGDWIYFRAHSMHDDSEVGDVCLAITDKGKTFVNYGHICGGIIHFIHKGDQIPHDAHEFQTKFISDTDELAWIKWP